MTRSIGGETIEKMDEINAKLIEISKSLSELLLKKQFGEIMASPATISKVLTQPPIGGQSTTGVPHKERALTPLPVGGQEVEGAAKNSSGEVDQQPQFHSPKPQNLFPDDAFICCNTVTNHRESPEGAPVYFSAAMGKSQQTQRKNKKPTSFNWNFSIGPKRKKLKLKSTNSKGHKVLELRCVAVPSAVVLFVDTLVDSSVNDGLGRPPELEWSKTPNDSIHTVFSQPCHRIVFSDLHGNGTSIVEDVGHVRSEMGVKYEAASWGAYLLSRNTLTMSFAPKHTHEAQIQFACKRGVHARIGIMATQGLSYPSRAFESAHGFRCLIPWANYDGLYSIEVDQIIRPGGYWILSGPTINWGNHWKELNRINDDPNEEKKGIVRVAESLCWKKLVQRNDLAIWQKSTNHLNCILNRKIFKKPSFCQGTDPDRDWYTKVGACLTPLPEVDRALVAKWPKRLKAVPPRIQSGNIEGVTKETFEKVAQIWKKRVEYYKAIDRQQKEKGRYRNLLIMNAGLRGFEAALVDDPVGMMNLVPPEAPTNALSVNIRDDIDELVSVKSIVDRLQWASRMTDHEGGPQVRERLFVATKQLFWITYIFLMGLEVGLCVNSTLLPPLRSSSHKDKKRARDTSVGHIGRSTFSGSHFNLEDKVDFKGDGIVMKQDCHNNKGKAEASEDRTETYTGLISKKGTGQSFTCVGESWDFINSVI